MKKDRPTGRCLRVRFGRSGFFHSYFSSMSKQALLREVRRRRTFAIISHPDAGKTTLTEKLLLFGGAIQMAGAVKGRKAARHVSVGNDGRNKGLLHIFPHIY